MRVVSSKKKIFLEVLTALGARCVSFKIPKSSKYAPFPSMSSRESNESAGVNG